MSSSNGASDGDDGAVADSDTRVPDDEEKPTLFSLSWEDVTFSHILPHLQWKDLFQLRSTSWECKSMVDAYFKQLKTVDLTEVESTFTDEAFQLVTSSCTNIRKLVINGAKWIIDKDLSTLFKNNKSLSYLDLSYCTCLNGSCLLSLAVNCKQIHTLKLRQCNWLSLGAVETMLAHLDSIKAVDLTCCSRMSNLIMLPFFQRFQKLETLRLGNLQTVNDTTLLMICRCNGPTLEFLDVSGCPNISDRGTKMVAEYCKNLRALHVQGCNLVTEYSLSLLRARGVLIDREKARLGPHMPLYLQV